MIRTLSVLALIGSRAHAEEPAQPPAAPASSPVTYTLDPVKSWLYVVVRNDTSSLASRLGHDHAIRATEFTGKVTWDTTNAAACAVDLSFPVNALRPDPPGMRERAGLPADGAVSESQLATIRENFLGKGQLDAATFPTISYKAKTCEGTTGKVKVTGDLTIHGVTKPVSLTLDVKADPTSFAAGGSFTTTHTNFGMKPFTNLGGALRNKDELDFVLDLQGTKTP